MGTVDLARDISLTQLRYFIRVAERESMTRAAEDLFVAQSAVSSAIAHLERELDVQLFVRRHAKGVVLTSAGAQLLIKARGLLNSLAEALGEVAGDAHVTWGTLQVACFASISPFYLPAIVTSLKAEHPTLELQVTEAIAPQVNELLESGRVEIALTYDLGLSDAIARESLAWIRPYVAVSADDPLARADSVRIADLTDKPMILVDFPHSRDYFLGIFSDRGLRPNIAHRSTSFETVRAMVALGNGYSILHQHPASATSYAGGEVVAVPIEDEVPSLEVVLAQLKTMRTSERARLFAEHSRRIVSR